MVVWAHVVEVDVVMDYFGEVALGFFGVGDKITGAVTDVLGKFVSWVMSTVIGALTTMNSSLLAVMKRTPLTDLQLAVPTYNLVWGVSLSVGMAALLLSVTSAALSGKPGTGARRLVVDAPKYALITATMLSWTSGVLIATEEINTFLLDSPAGENLERVLTLSDIMPPENGKGAGLFLLSAGVWLLPFFVVAVLQLLVSLVLMVVLNLRDMSIFLFAALTPLMAVSVMTPYHKLFRKFLESLFGVIISKTIIIVALLVGASIVTEFRGENFEPLTLEAPSASGETSDADSDDTKAALEDQAGSNLFQRAILGLTVMFMSLIAPQQIIKLIPGAEAGGESAGMRQGGLMGQARSVPGVGAAGRARDRRNYRRMIGR